MELRDNLLVSGNADSTVRVWDVRTGQCLHTLQGTGRARGCVCIRLVGGVLLHPVVPGLCGPLHSGGAMCGSAGPNRHQSAVTCLQFCRGLVLSSSDDGTVKLWDLRTGAWVRDLVSLQSQGSGTYTLYTNTATYIYM